MTAAKKIRKLWRGEGKTIREGRSPQSGKKKKQLGMGGEGAASGKRERLILLEKSGEKEKRENRVARKNGNGKKKSTTSRRGRDPKWEEEFSENWEREENRDAGEKSASIN